MKKMILLSIFATAALSATAVAADLPARTYTKAPAPMVSPAFSWTGFYVGGNVGGIWDRSSWTDDARGNIIGPNLTRSSDGSSVIGGGQVGFNYQVNQFVFGVEGDYTATRIRSSFNFPAGAVVGCAGAPPGVCTTSQDWIATIRGRGGLAFDRFFIYGTGGVAFTEIGHITTFPGFPGAPASFGTQSRTGWVAGLGGEYAITNNWIAGVEWKYYDFGTTSAVATPLAIYNTTMRFRETENSVVGRLSYKFDWAGPVIAKY